MHGNAPNVLGIFPPPDQEDCVKAISTALVKVRANRGMTCEQIGKIVGACGETIRQAMAESGSVLSFVTIARLGYFFAEEFTEIEALWLRSTAPTPTVSDRLERIERELDAIRREAA